MKFYVTIRQSMIKTEAHNTLEEFLDTSTLAYTPEESLTKARASAKLHSTSDFDVDSVQPVVRIVRVEIREI